MSDWRDDGYDEEAERELERARRADRSRSHEPQRVGAMLPSQMVPRAVPVRCAQCGFEADRLRLDPLNGGRLVCVMRTDESGARIDCYDRLDRELQRRHDVEVAETRKVIVEAKARGWLTDADRAFLKSIPNGKDSIEALEKRFQRIKDRDRERGYARPRRSEDEP